MIVNEKYSNKAHPFGSNGGHRRPAASGIPGKNGFATGSKEQIEAPQVPSERSEKTVEDTAAADTMEIFRERMQRWNLLHESCLSKPDK